MLTAISTVQKVDIAYSPYGHRQNPGPLPGFNGQDADPLTGHYLLGNGYRAYNPVLGRFNSPDSLSPFGDGGLNAYAWCHGNPINRSDPSGHALEDQISSFLWIGLGFFGAAWGLKLAVPNSQRAQGRCSGLNQAGRSQCGGSTGGQHHIHRKPDYLGG